MNTIIQKSCYFVFAATKPIYFQFLLLGMIFKDKFTKYLDRKPVRYLVILTPLVIFFLRIVRNDPFFLSDDFAHLSLSSQNSYLDIIRMALAKEGIWVGHRIISGFFIFKFIFDLFGTNIYPYIITIFLFHAFNSLLFYELNLYILKDKYFAVLGGFVFSSFYLNWISNIHELVGGTFLLLTLLSWLFFLKHRKKKNVYLSLGFYVFAILSKEILFLTFFAVIAVTLIFLNGKLRSATKYILLPVTLFALIFISYGLLYARGFGSYFSDYVSTSYEMSISFAVVLSNFVKYFSLIMPFAGSISVIAIVFLVVMSVDLVHKRSTATLLLGVYLIFQLPSLFFVGRTALYYIYYPLIFLIPATMLFLKQSDSILRKYFSKMCAKTNTFYIVVQRIYTPVFVIFVIFTVFGMNTKLMDNCYLIQTPWKNEKKQSILQVAKAIDAESRSGRLGLGTRISLDDVSQPDDVIEISGTKVLNLFLVEDKAQTYSYCYNLEENALYAEKRCEK